MGFIDMMRAEGHAAWSICRVLREQDCQIAARTYRAWTTGAVADRTVTDAQVLDPVRTLAWVTILNSSGRKRRKLTPEGLYGRRKITALIRRTIALAASRGWSTEQCVPWDFRASTATRAPALASPRKTESVRVTC